MQDVPDDQHASPVVETGVTLAPTTTPYVDTVSTVGLSEPSAWWSVWMPTPSTSLPLLISLGALAIAASTRLRQRRLDRSASFLTRVKRAESGDGCLVELTNTGAASASDVSLDFYRADGSEVYPFVLNVCPFPFVRIAPNGTIAFRVDHDVASMRALTVTVKWRDERAGAHIHQQNLGV